MQKGIKIDYEKAKAQHKEYIKALRWLSIKNIKILPEDGNYPDCCFVEDCAVVFKNKALICNMGDNTEKEKLKKQGISLKKHIK